MNKKPEKDFRQTIHDSTKKSAVQPVVRSSIPSDPIESIAGALNALREGSHITFSSDSVKLFGTEKVQIRNIHMSVRIVQLKSSLEHFKLLNPRILLGVQVFKMRPILANYEQKSIVKVVEHSLRCLLGIPNNSLQMFSQEPDY